MKTVYLAIATFLSLSATAADNKYVTVASIPAKKLVQGKTVDVVVPVTVAPGYHIQANPAGGPQLVATTLEVKPETGFLIGSAVYPKGKPYHLPGTTGEIATYDGKIELKVSVTAGMTSKVGAHRLEGKLKYQACNEKNCFFPTTATVEIPVNVAAK